MSKIGWIEGARQVPTVHVGGQITPDIVVLHDTAGRLKKGSSVAYLAANPAKVSAHFVIELDGEVVQLAPINRRTSHAGRSNYHGRPHCNGFSIGIEIVNPGRLEGDGTGGATAWFGRRFDVNKQRLRRVDTKAHGDGFWWMPYTEAQIAAVIALCGELVEACPDIHDIVPHWYISPGRKTDTNPLFPLEHVKSRVFGRSDPADRLANVMSTPQTDEAFVEIDVSPTGIGVQSEALNMRRWPSFNPNVIAQIPNGTAVPVLRRGSFDGRRWLKVQYGGAEGWIVERYTAAVSMPLEA